MIEMQNVSFSYPDSADGGLKNINLTIPDEQCVLLCGRSGCGKTTLTRLINGLIPQFFAGELTGKVLLDGENLFDLPMYRIAEKVGSVFQNPRTQFFNVDTDSEIAFGMENEAVPQEQMGQRVVETAKALRIENLLGRNIFALSGGEKQKIAFASVYAMNPQIYLLDEPSSNLDMAAIHDLRAHLRLIKSQGKTIVVAEHRLYYLMDVADRIVYLDNGHIAGDWTPEQFRLLSTEKRQSMGLRALDLQDEKPICAAVPKQPPVLELQNVSLAYKKQPVLRNLSLQAAPGDIIAIVGHNGAGKTTFSRALCGLHKETSGSYLWNGNPQKPKERMKSSYTMTPRCCTALTWSSPKERSTRWSVPPAAANPPLPSSSPPSGMWAAAASPWAARTSAAFPQSITTSSLLMCRRITSCLTTPCEKISAWADPMRRTPRWNRRHAIAAAMISS